MNDVTLIEYDDETEREMIEEFAAYHRARPGAGRPNSAAGPGVSSEAAIFWYSAVWHNRPSYMARLLSAVGWGIFLALFCPFLERKEPKELLICGQNAFVCRMCTEMRILPVSRGPLCLRRRC